MVFNDECRYAEILYFFVVQKDDLQHTLAAVQIFSLPDPRLLNESYGTLHVCRFPGSEFSVLRMRFLYRIPELVWEKRPLLLRHLPANDGSRISHTASHMMFNSSFIATTLIMFALLLLSISACIGPYPIHHLTTQGSMSVL